MVASSSRGGYFVFRTMKRQSDREDNGTKRSKGESSIGKYTQGPLDHVFGQHAAFPIQENAQDPVYEYLAGVRREAECTGVFFAPKKATARPPEQERARAIPLGAAFIEGVVSQLVAEKAENESFEQEIQVSVESDESEQDDEGQRESEDQDGESEDQDGESEDQEQDEEQPKDESQGDQSSRHVSQCDDAVSDAQDAEQEDLMQVPQSANAWRTLVFSSPPPKDFFARLEHPTVIKLVVYFTRWLSPSMPASASEWLWQVFVRLDCGLVHTELAIVRDLGLKARKLRLKHQEQKGSDKEGESKITTEDCSDVRENPGPSETIDRVLAVVGSYYGQRDLLE
ncbi:putative pre-mRNA-splicing factor [Clavispora lusitaniae]|uniref:Pre-mRNA-splicing factor n=1 Tax=Clavispora lusitaniae TaxID=36911 RepID=A0ACD0WSN7_CLALS|nr:hypothetical protein E0198_005089 [Clavispora lusitaniae]QFZ30477.1 putative pre-mRNA-splicing factor [Clavispora lusitaniae]QFZ36139.1 putative pre-mRNA-splicing factor [Clavispora lusitaniae]QFZ41823.1 putative pre-mRNA-splicing factor [Clavispora lusitaniae]QFZ47499.1 putative pre-mRNA-splicing factor [Clavispora lusitaniae]